MLFIKWVLILGLHDIQAQTGRDIFHMNYSYLPQVGLTQNKGKVEVKQFDIYIWNTASHSFWPTY